MHVLSIIIHKYKELGMAVPACIFEVGFQIIMMMTQYVHLQPVCCETKTQ